MKSTSSYYTKKQCEKKQSDKQANAPSQTRGPIQHKQNKANTPQPKDHRPEFKNPEQ
jgi:hypothetical protein